MNETEIALAKLEIRMERGFNGIDARFNSIDTKFNGIDTKFNGMDARFNALGAKIWIPVAAAVIQLLTFTGAIILHVMHVL